jgi:hypothetical protein
MTLKKQSTNQKLAEISVKTLHSGYFSKIFLTDIQVNKEKYKKKL